MKKNPRLFNPGENRRGEIEHSRRGYWRGCRCEVCRADLREYTREKRSRIAFDGTHPESWAVSQETYTAGCRCTGCRAAHAAYTRAHRPAHVTEHPAHLKPSVYTYDTLRCPCDACRTAATAYRRERRQRKAAQHER